MDNQQRVDLVRSYVAPVIQMTWGCICLVPEGKDHLVIDLRPRGVTNEEAARVFSEVGLGVSVVDGLMRLSCNHGSDHNAILNALIEAEKWL